MMLVAVETCAAGTITPTQPSPIEGEGLGRGSRSAQLPVGGIGLHRVPQKKPSPSMGLLQKAVDMIPSVSGGTG
jgi:hypothetical protein